MFEIFETVATDHEVQHGGGNFECCNHIVVI